MVPLCIVVLSSREKANQIKEKLLNAATPLTQCVLITPGISKNPNIQQKQQGNGNASDEKLSSSILEPVDIETIRLLNPQLLKQLRQRRMAMGLMPFGFLAGLTFSQMTNLTTFADLGIGALGENLSGGLVGMISGWMGSFVGAASVKSKNSEDINTLRKLNEQGFWLLLLETPIEVEIPWRFLKEVGANEVVRLIDQ